MEIVHEPNAAPAALQAAGVPIDTNLLTRRDTDRLRDVLGRLRNMVVAGKLARDFRFEEVFAVAQPNAYQEQRSTSESYAYTNFDHSADGQSAENKSHTEGGIKTDFSSHGFGRVSEILAPLINPADLATISALMHAHIEAQGER
ncbi:hypothetical protein CU048_06510 [Beijerinckiaceae bacterium]|nr:hypothetical protein CU048_06510 [Beijerinckiaceae bacterium]